MADRPIDKSAALFRDLTDAVYQSLRAARAIMRTAGPEHTLSPTALLHEVFLRLQAATGIQNIPSLAESSFRALFCTVCRRVLIEDIRRRKSQKRGGDHQRMLIKMEMVESPEPRFDMLALNEALDTLFQTNADIAQVAELRLFGGLSHGEIAEECAVPERTVERRWQTARAWLIDQLKPGSA